MSLRNVDIKYFKLAIGNDKIGKETSVDISARCPICGDSKTNKREKRLHLYEKNGVTNVNCFNGDCSVQNKTVHSFLRDFYPTLLEHYKRESLNNTLSKLSHDNVFADITPLNSVQEDAKSIDAPLVQVQDLSMYMTPIENTNGLSYIASRGIDYDSIKNMFGKWYFGHQDLIINSTLYKMTNSVVIPLYYHNVMYGFYSRSIESKSFITYMNDVNIGYKIWNWFNVNKDEPVYIFEGIFDAISSGLTNVIALMGAKIPDARLRELKNPVFCLDNDKTGIMNAISYANKGYNIFVAPANFIEKDINEYKLKYGDPCNMILDNIYTGISGAVRLKAKL